MLEIQDKKNKKINFILLYTLFFVLLFILTTMAYWLYGKSFLWTSDGMSQHYPNVLYTREWLIDIVRELMNTGKVKIPMWDMTIGLGQDVFNSVAFRPLYFLYAIFREKQIEPYLIIRVIISLYLCGISFFIYARNFQHTQISILLGSLVYVFCGFNYYFAERHTFFLEMMIYLPLMCLGTDRILSQNKPALFIAVTAICGISNFYFLFMLVVPCFIYACIRYSDLRENRSWKDFLKEVLYFGGLFAFGIGLSAFSFVPSLYRFFSSSRGSSQAVKSYIHYGLKYYLDLITSVMSSREIGIYGFLGFSGIAFICIVYLLLNKKKNSYKGLKIGLLVAVIIFCIPICAMVFSGFAGKTNRWSYAVVLVVALIVSVVFDDLMQNFKKYSLKIGAGIGIYSLIYVCIKFLTGEKIEASLVLVWIYFFILLYIGRATDIGRRVAIIALCVLFSIDTALVAWSLYSPDGEDYISEFVDAGKINEERNNTSIAAMELTDDESVYRIDVLYPSISEKLRYRNYGLRSGYNGLSSFFSFSDKRIIEYENELAVSQQYLQFLLLDLDQRSVLNTLAAVKYVTVPESCLSEVPYGYQRIAEMEKTYVNGETENIYLYENKNALPLMYLYDSYIDTEEYSTFAPNEKEQAMLQGVVLKAPIQGYNNTNIKFNYNAVYDEEMLLEYIKKNMDPNEIEIIDNAIVVKKRGASVKIPVKIKKGCELYASFEGLLYQPFTYNEQKAYELGQQYTRYENMDYVRNNMFSSKQETAYINVSSDKTKTTIPLLSMEHQYYSGAKDKLANLGYISEDTTYVQFQFTSIGTYSFDEFSIISQPMDQYVSRVAKLAEDPVEDITIDCNTVTAHTTLSKDKILCIAIPYSDGWSAKVNGESVEVLEGNGMYMAIPLKTGYNNIELNYETPGIRLGIAISALAVGVLILILGIPAWWRTIQKIRRKRYH